MELNREQRLLRRYLDRYRNLTIKDKSLEREKEVLEKDFIGLHAISMDSGSKPSMAHSPVPPYVIKNEALLNRIIQKKKEAAEAMHEIETVIGMLPEEGYEHMALSLRYISRMPAEDIAEIISCDRRTVFRIVNRGIDKLLMLDTVKEIVNSFGNKILDF